MCFRFFDYLDFYEERRNRKRGGKVRSLFYGLIKFIKEIVLRCKGLGYEEREFVLLRSLLF